MQSPVGELKLVASDAGLSDIIWEHDHPNSTAGENSTENNDYPLLLPCHRMIGASGKLVGFGGGLPNKSYLLQIEAFKKSPTLW